MASDTVRPIDANALLREYPVSNNPVHIAVKCVPTLDAVPVVQCRECKHYREYERCSMSAVYRHCALHKGLAMVTPDSFCSYSERRE